MSYFPEPCTCNKKKRVKLDFNYAIKSDLKSATGIHTSKFTKDVDLASLKSNVR